MVNASVQCAGTPIGGADRANDFVVEGNE